MTPAHIFRSNLRKLANQLGYSTPQQLAKALNFKLNDLRWIKRLWKDGLDHIDRRREENITTLATFFGVKPVDLWREGVEIGPTDLVNDTKRWAEVVREVIEVYRSFQHMKLHQRDKANHALYRYDYDEPKLLADIVASRLGLERPDLVRLDFSFLDDVRKQDPEWKAVENDDGLAAFITEQSTGHEWFPPFVTDLTRKYGEKADEHFRNILLDIQRRPRSPVEVLDEFQALCLNSFTEDDGFEVFMREITRDLRHIWRIAVEKNDQIDPEEFAKPILQRLKQAD